MISIWLGVIVALILVEFISRNLTSSCFILSSIISCILVILKTSYYVQVGEFLIVGIILLVVVRPKVLPILEEKISFISSDKIDKDKKSKKVKNNKSKNKI